MGRGPSPKKAIYQKMRIQNIPRDQALSELKVNPRTAERWESEISTIPQVITETKIIESESKENNNKIVNAFGVLWQGIVYIFQTLWTAIINNIVVTIFFLLTFTGMTILIIWSHNSLASKHEEVLRRLNQRLENERKTIEILEERLKDAENLREDHETLRKDHEAQAKLIEDLKRQIKENSETKYPPLGSYFNPLPTTTNQKV
jgi:hypothetical protein